MSSTTDVKPWYKHPWVWVLITIPIVSLILSFSMLYVAMSNKDSEVTDDWYTKGKAVNQDFARDNYASALTISADLTLTSQQATVRVNSSYALDDKALPASLSLEFSHPTDAKRDLTLKLLKQADGSYQAAVSAPLSGRYYVTLSNSAWRLKDMIFLPLNETYTLHPEPLKQL